jgi:hypothetical protein
VGIGPAPASIDPERFLPYSLPLDVDAGQQSRNSEWQKVDASQ